MGNKMGVDANHKHMASLLIQIFCVIDSGLFLNSFLND